METSAPGPARVVVIDDDSAVRHSLKFVLEIAGYHVAVYPAAALPDAESDIDTAACLIVDHELSPVTGLDLLVRLRDRGRSTPAVLTVVHLPLRQTLIAQERGIAVLYKPIVAEDLLRAVERVVAPR